ncbi:MAG: glycosyltransferase family 2 protein [Nanoarchaeota archaeon]
MIKKSEVLILLPAFNEGKVISNVIKLIKSEGYKNIAVVDDCSKDDTFKLAEKAGAIVLKHVINRGAGGATATGIEFAKREGYEYLVIMDSDGQHCPKDISRLLKFSEKYDVVIGSRMINNKGMPIVRKVANSAGSLITWFFFGLYVKDSQSGFKVFNRKAINSIKITFDRFEFCSEIIGEIYANKLKFKEVPIKVIYTDHSRAKGQSIKNGFKMIGRFIMRG